jgi:UDP-GlcNAc:undecaprenyl-phosphate/decaprenyl-phosphate GlcNAc-1-phosphate transferase
MSLALTALIREIAPRIGLTDNPDGHRKLHGRATPLGGGVAVYLTTTIILGTLWMMPSSQLAPTPISDGQMALVESVLPPEEASEVDPLPLKKSLIPSTADQAEAGDELANLPQTEIVGSRISMDISTKLRTGYPHLPSLLFAGLVIVIVGLIDDKVGLPGKIKLLGQIVAACILMAGGLLIENFVFLNTNISLGWLAFPVTLFWLLGAINALNLLDGLDGLATMLGIILSSTIAVMSVVTGNYGVAIIAMVFTGSLLGFLKFNFPPASIFLGDTGSMLIGLMVGGLAIHGSLKGPGTVLLAAPLAVWTIPFFDSFAAILRRKLTGRSIYATDRGHLHHRLMNALGSNRKVLVWVAAACIIISIATIVGLVLKDDRITILTCVAVIAIFVVSGIFGRVELLLVGNGIRRFGHIISRPIRRSQTWQSSIQLQGSREWDLLWVTFIESADKLRLRKIRLDVNMPTMHEAYHAAWERPIEGPSDRCWNVEIPLVIGKQTVGRIQVTGFRNGQSACLDIQQLMELIEPFEVRLTELTEQDSSPKSIESAQEPVELG